MEPYLIKPVVRTWECNMLTPLQFGRLLKRLNSKKFGAKIVAVDVDEIVTNKSTRLYDGNPDHLYVHSVKLPPGNYFNVHVEYVV